MVKLSFLMVRKILKLIRENYNVIKYFKNFQHHLIKGNKESKMNRKKKKTNYDLMTFSDGGKNRKKKQKETFDFMSILFATSEKVSHETTIDSMSINPPNVSDYIEKHITSHITLSI